jgi:hypothetical protein
MLWSDQATGSFRFASHQAGDDPTVWAQEVAVQGPAEADNHVSVTRVPGEAGDTLVAVVKTGDGDALGNPAAGRIELLVRPPGGGWKVTRVSEVEDRLNDPVLQVDLVTRTVHVFATHELSIIRKTASLDDPRFAAGIGDIFVNGAGHQLSDPTTAKEPADARSGIVVLASDPRGFAYRHAELALTPPTPVTDPGDRQPPTTPSALRAQVISPESVVLSWDAANDGDRWVPGGTGVPVAGYVVSRNGVEVDTVTSTSMEDQARTAGQATEAASIEYSITAVDAAGNRSAPVTLTVELPGAQQTRALVIGALALLGLAGLVLIGLLVHRRVVDRGTGLPLTEEPAIEEPRNATPVS